LIKSFGSREIWIRSRFFEALKFHFSDMRSNANINTQIPDCYCYIPLDALAFITMTQSLYVCLNPCVCI
jgi:hypothetical protein